jgi:HEPN domain-containing protein
MELVELDLASARQLLAGTPPILGNASFHSQQAMEKSLKAFLIAHGLPERWTHDLEQLVRECERLDTAFAAWRHAAAILTPYATRVRYPIRGQVLRPTESQVRQALQHATNVATFVRERLDAFQKPPPSSP